MGKKTVFTNITPLPAQVSREVAISILHDHAQMIELNPLVIEHHAIGAPRYAAKDEYFDCAWHEMTDRIPMVGNMAKKKITYTGCFHDIPGGLQTHVYAPLGVDIRETWKIGGSLEGEPVEPRELGLNTPRKGLYLREDGEIKCSLLWMGKVRTNLDRAHSVLVERIMRKAERMQSHLDSGGEGVPERSIRSRREAFQRRSFSDQSHATSHSRQLSSRQNLAQELPTIGLSGPRKMDSAQSDITGRGDGLQNIHPALREQYLRGLTGDDAHDDSMLPRYDDADSQRQNVPEKGRAEQFKGKTFLAELEGSMPATPQVQSRPPPINECERPQTVYGPVSEVSDESLPEKLGSSRHSRTRSQPLDMTFSNGPDSTRRDQAINRFSVVSGMSDLATPKMGPVEDMENRYSVVSDISQAPTPQFQQQTFAFAQNEARLAQERHMAKFI